MTTSIRPQHYKPVCRKMGIGASVRKGRIAELSILHHRHYASLHTEHKYTNSSLIPTMAVIARTSVLLLDFQNMVP